MNGPELNYAWAATIADVLGAPRREARRGEPRLEVRAARARVRRATSARALADSRRAQRRVLRARRRHGDTPFFPGYGRSSTSAPPT